MDMLVFTGGSEFGIVSCIAANPGNQDLFALGSLSRNGTVTCYTLYHYDVMGGKSQHYLDKIHEKHVL